MAAAASGAIRRLAHDKSANDTANPLTKRSLTGNYPQSFGRTMAATETEIAGYERIRKPMFPPYCRSSIPLTLPR